jgi:hypothetical protein
MTVFLIEKIVHFFHVGSDVVPGNLHGLGRLLHRHWQSSFHASERSCNTWLRQGKLEQQILDASAVIGSMDFVDASDEVKAIREIIRCPM